MIPVSITDICNYILFVSLIFFRLCRSMFLLSVLTLVNSDEEVRITTLLRSSAIKSVMPKSLWRILTAFLEMDSSL